MSTRVVILTLMFIVAAFGFGKTTSQHNVAVLSIPTYDMLNQAGVSSSK